MWSCWNRQRTRALSIGCASLHWTRAIPFESPSNSPPITKRPSPATRSTPQRLCTNAVATGALTLSFDEDVPHKTEPEAPCVGVDVGIANFIMTSTGKSYGSFQGDLAKKHKRDREKRRRKAKLRASLEKKGVPRNSCLLPAARPDNVWVARCARISTALSTRCWLITLMLALRTKSSLWRLWL